MRDRFFAAIAAINEGIDVCDISGDKVGKAGGIYQPAAVSATATTTAEPTGELYLKVDTGFLGMGKDLFIPGSAISDVTAERVTLNVGKDRVDAMGWDRQPDWLRDGEV